MAGRGRRFDQEAARAAARKRWAKKRSSDPETLRILEEAALERRAQLQEAAMAQALALEYRQKLEAQAQRLSPSSPAAAPASIPDSTDGVAGTIDAVGHKFSIVGSVGPAVVVDDYLLPRGAVVDLPGGARGPGAPGPRDLPAPDTQISSPKSPKSPAPTLPQPAPAPARPVGQSLWCRGCGALVRDAIWSGHSCRNQPQHVAQRWSTIAV